MKAKEPNNNTCVALLAALLGLPIAPLANPSAPEFGGVWDANATAGPAYNQQTTTLKINDGVSVTVTNTTIAVSGDYTWSDHMEGGTLNNYGIIDMTAWSGRLVQIRNSSTFTANNIGTFTFGDGTPSHYDFGGTLNFYNGGTLAKTAGPETFSFVQANGTFNYHNYHVDGSGTTNGGTLRVDVGTLHIGGVTWFFQGTQSVTVAAGAILQAPDAGNHLFGGTWEGTGDGLVLLFGGSTVNIDNTFTVNIDNGDQTSYTNGCVKLGGSFRGTGDSTLLNRGKFWFTADGRWQAGAPGLHLHNEGWLVWDPAATLDHGWAAGSDLVNKSNGVIDIVGSVGDGTKGATQFDVFIESGSFLNKRISAGTANWDNREFTIEDDANIHVQTGELEIRCADVYFGPSTPPTSDLKFNVTIDDGATLDIDDIPAAGITNIDSGTTLHMKGGAVFMDGSTDVLSNKLSTVKGTLLFSDGFTLTPNGTLTVTPSGTFGGTGTLDGNLNCAGTFNVGTNGVIADKITANGTVTLSGPLQLADALDSLPGTYVIIDNDGEDAVSGTFSGIPQGKVIKVGSKNYRVSYVGGDGNDVEISFRARGTVLQIL